MTLESLNIKQQKLKELQKLFPEIFEDGKVDHEKLKVILGDSVDDSSEHYSFEWNGKRDCYKTIREKTNATLKVDEDKSIPDGDNVFIEGDNMEVLKLLQLSYHKKIKMIYIDPPYNKDKDFVYSDTWGDSIQNYLMQTDQLRDEGYTSTKNNSTGRRHTNWLNMIYPRLWLSRNLLKDDGVIFVSIDDDEVANLRKVMDEIYGEENFLADIIWEKRFTRSNDAKLMASVIDHTLLYRKSDKLKVLREARSEKNDSIYSNSDNDPRGKWTSVSYVSQRTKEQRKNLSYQVKNPFTNELIEHPTNAWKFSFEQHQKHVKNNELYWGKTGGHQYPRLKKFYEDIKDKGVVPINLWNHKETGSIDVGTKEVDKLLGKGIFDYPKPTTLIRRMLRMATVKDDEDIVLDFFGGSGTTAHAVIAQNNEDDGNRKYILVQLPEATDEKSEAHKEGYKKISDITKERIKRVIKKLDYKEGFKSFRLDNSNFQIFKEVKKRPEMSYAEIEKMLKMSMFHENILTQGAKELDIVYEVGLKNGFTLSAEVAEVKTDKYSFTTLSEDERVYYFSFDKQIEGDIVYAVPEGTKLICYEKALNTNVKLNLRENLDLEVL